MPAAPLFDEVGIVAVVPNRWSGLWTTRHHVLSRLSRYFRVVWLEPNQSWHPRKWRTWLLRTRSPRLQDVEGVPTSSSLTVLPAGAFVPSMMRLRPAHRMVQSWRLRRACQVLRRQGCRRIVLYLWRPYFADALDLIEHDLSCYHIDDDYSFSGTDEVNEVEARLIARVHQVFVTSRELLRCKGAINPHTAFAPNGVDYAAYAGQWPEPPDLRPIPHPRIGYAGAIKGTLDWPLLIQLARDHLDWQFVFVGSYGGEQAGVADAVRALIQRRNVHFLGGKSPVELPAYPAHFDACMMPYRTDTHSMKYGYPLKLHEYLAAGRPVVSSPLRALEEFRNVVTLAQTPEEWAAALSRATSGREIDRALVEMRQAVARRHDWNVLVGEIGRTLAARLGLPFEAQRAESPTA